MDWWMTSHALWLVRPKKQILPILLESRTNTAYGILVVCLAGCFSKGRTYCKTIPWQCSKHEKPKKRTVQCNNTSHEVRCQKLWGRCADVCGGGDWSWFLDTFVRPFVWVSLGVWCFLELVSVGGLNLTECRMRVSLLEEKNILSPFSSSPISRTNRIWTSPN